MALHTPPTDPRDLNDSTTQLAALVGEDRDVLLLAGGDASPAKALAKVLADQACRVEVVETSSDGSSLSSRFEPGSFHVVVFGDLLAHLSDPQAALRDATSLLGAGGRILTSVANAGHGAHRLAFLQGQAAPRAFTSHSLCDLLEAAGLTVEELHSTVRDPLDGDVAVDADLLPDLVIEWMRHQPDALDHRFVAVARRRADGQPQPPRPRVRAALPGSAVRIEDLHTQRMRDAQDEQHRRLLIRDHIIGLEAAAASANDRVVRAAARAKASYQRARQHRDELESLRLAIEQLATSKSTRDDLRRLHEQARRRHEGEGPTT